jgi:hypothetical protein
MWRSNSAPQIIAELLTASIEEYVRADHQGSGSQLNRACKGRVELALGARMEDMEFKPKPACGNLRLSRCGLRLRGIGRIDEEPNDSGVWYHFVQQLSQLRRYLHV